MADPESPRQLIQLTHLHTYAGPNVYAADPVIVVRATMTEADPAINRQRFAAAARKFPRWRRSVPPADADDRYDIGEGLASFAKWLLNDVRGIVSTAKCLPDGAARLIVLGYHDPRISLRALQIAALVFEHIDGDAGQELARQIAEFAPLCRRHHPDFQAMTLMQAAVSRDIPVLPFVRGTRFWQYGWGSRSRVFAESLSNADGSIASLLEGSKARSKAFFQSLGIPTPSHILVLKIEELDEAIRRIGYPCVIKPLDQGCGKGVTANIVNHEQLVRAFESARKSSAGALMLEQFVPGEDYRLMVIDGKFVAAIHRQPSFVIADGSSTVRELVDGLNATRSVDLLGSRYLRPISFDAVLSGHLANQGWCLDDVLPPGIRVSLRSNANLSTGGVCADVTAKVHGSVREMAEQIAASAGFGAAGLDYITTDISTSPWESGGVFIEMNSTPGLDVAMAAGWTPEIIGNLVLGTQVGRIPVELYLTDRQPESFPLGAAGYLAAPSLAIVSGNEVQVGRALYRVQETRPWAAMAAALRNQAVTALQIHCSLRDITENGLPVDRVDRLVIRGVSVPDCWMRVLQDHSAEVVVESL